MMNTAKRKSETGKGHLDVVKPATADDVKTTLLRQTSHDLVFAVVGHIGAGASTVADDLERALGKNRSASRIKLSELIAETAIALDPGQEKSIRSANKMERVKALQDAGNWLRKEKGSAFTAGLAIEKMHKIRGDQKDPIIFIIDSLKNKSEVDALRKVYGRAFYLISVVCSPERRLKRLKEGKLRASKEADIKKLETLIARDEHEDGDWGQQVQETIQLGDFFVDNEEPKPEQDTSDPIVEALQRFLHAVFGTDLIRPTRAERGMYAAWSASLRSSCLSRQVGAAILNEEGLLIATGTNDVPKAHGGLYEVGASPDYRCFTYADKTQGEEHGFCRNDKAKEDIYQEIIEALREGGVLVDGIDDASLRNLLKRTSISDLIEFSRAVHAEMDAIVNIARTGGAITKGATLYCTTYPCHNCARHIVASGIREVIYIEPYTKSRAAKLHADSIRVTAKSPDKNPDHVCFRQFTGVAPRRFSALFEKRTKLKKEGRLFLSAEDDNLHADPVFKKSHLDFEELIAQNIAKALHQKSDASESE